MAGRIYHAHRLEMGSSLNSGPFLKVPNKVRHPYNHKDPRREPNLETLNPKPL